MEFNGIALAHTVTIDRKTSTLTWKSGKNYFRFTGAIVEVGIELLAIL